MGTPLLRQGGCYLIIGGVGGVGLSLAEHLARTYGAHLILTSRSGTPTGDDPESALRRQRLAEVQAMAASVEIVTADATSSADMAARIA